MSHERPRHFGVIQLLDAQLARERTVGLVVNVLRRHADLLVRQAACEQEVEGWRGDDDFGVGVEVGGVEVGDDVGDGLGGSVPGETELLAKPGGLQVVVFPEWEQSNLEGLDGGVLESTLGVEHLEVSSDEEFASHGDGVRGDG